MKTNQNAVNKKEVKLSIVGPQAFHVERGPFVSVEESFPTVSAAGEPFSIKYATGGVNY